jgi:phage gp45-like
MTTSRDGYEDRIRRFGQGFTDGQGTEGDAWSDPNKEYPDNDYDNQPTTNKTSRAGQQHQLFVGAGINLTPLGSTAYNSSDTNETVSGHVFEMNDTPGAERILIKHNTAHGIDIRPDGSIVIVAGARRVEVVHGEQTVVVEGDGTLTYKGNLTLNVDGDFEVNCNNYKVNAKGDKKENIEGNSRTSVFGNFGHKVSGNFSQTVAGSSVNTFLGNTTNAVKGTYKTAVEGDIIQAASGNMEQTAEAKLIQSAPDINVAAQSLSIFGDTGTIGGQNIIMYNYNMHTEKTVWSETVSTNVVYGDLEGNAKTATTAGTSLHQSYPDGSAAPSTYTPSIGVNPNYTVDDTARDIKATALPTGALLTSYLTQGDNGIKEVKIDVDDFLRNALRLRRLSTGDVRSKMRDPANSGNSEFTTEQVGKGTLSPEFATSAPFMGFGRVRPAKGTTQTNSEYFGNIDPSRRAKTFKSYQNKQTYTLLNNFTKGIDEATTISNLTPISQGITLSRFIGGVDTGPFVYLDLAERQTIARNYIAHMELTKRCMGITSKWAEHELRVIEGYYAKELYGLGHPSGLSPETITPNSLLDLRTKGRAVVYELYGPDGFIDAEGTFDLASELADVGLYDKLILDYDSYDPSGDINVQLIVQIPEIPKNYTIRYEQICQTMFNNYPQSLNTFVEPIFDTEAAEYIPKFMPTRRTV